MPRSRVDGQRAVGVRYLKGDHDWRRAHYDPATPCRRRRVMLAGALSLAAAPADVGCRAPEFLLQSLGIPVRHASPGVRETPARSTTRRACGALKNSPHSMRRIRGLKLAPKSQMCPGRQSILASRRTQVLRFWQSEPHLDSRSPADPSRGSYQERPAVQLEMSPAGRLRPGSNGPESNVYVRIKSAAPFQQSGDPAALSSPRSTDAPCVVAAMLAARQTSSNQSPRSRLTTITISPP